MNSFVALDVEIASRSPLHVCAVGAVRIVARSEQAAFYSLVSTPGRVRYTDVHGLSSSDLRGAPSWPAVWNRLTQLLRGIDTIVAFRASFDRGAILSMCGRYGQRVPRLSFACAAEIAAASCGCRHLTLAEVLGFLRIPFPGRPHDPLADARAAAAIALECSPWPAAARLR